MLAHSMTRCIYAASALILEGFAFLVIPRLAPREQFRHDCHIMSHDYTPLMFVGAGLVLALLLWWIHQRY